MKITIKGWNYKVKIGRIIDVTIYLFKKHQHYLLSLY